MTDKRRNHGISARRLRRPIACIMLAITYLITFSIMAMYVANSNEMGTVQEVIGAGVVLFGAYAAFTVHLMFAAKQVMGDPKKLLMICVTLLAIVLISMLMMRVDPCFSVMLIAVLVFTLMVDERVALAVVAVTSIATALIAMFDAESFQYAVGVGCANAVSGITAVYALRMRRTRSSTIVASAIAALVGVLAYTGVMLTGGVAFADFWDGLLWFIGSSLLGGIVTVGIMPLLEIMFDVATEARLNELLNNNNPLLKRLMMEAPGTYHHSVLVASLAEAAAENIGADALLCKVGAYYHDVGKLRSPMYFKENQRPNYNIHDELDPYESAQRIIAHQRDGVTLLSKYRMPGAVIRIVAEHHGDSVVFFFYDKAKRLAPAGAQVDEKLFRYPSQKPSTKEGAIVLLADCCEAAVRSMTNCTMSDIESKVKDVITHKWNKRDGMLWASPLTFYDIVKIERSFIKTFAALHHERIEYPDWEDNDVR